MYIAIMAGGSGTRFWPASRQWRPKQFLNIIGDTPMVLATYQRIQALAPDERILLVVGEQHRAETERLFAHTAVNILAEPVGRNTAPCIGLAAKYVERLGGGGPIVILPADHFIADAEVFRACLRRAAEVASDGGIVTLGIVPTRPETGYGYIERGAESEQENVFRVVKFVEKPDLQTAGKYLAAGNYFWNAGIFVATPQTLLAEFSRQMPAFFAGLEQLSASFGQPQFAAQLKSLYEQTESISFDYAIMEKTTKPVHVVPANCGWSDVGSWFSLYEVRREKEKDGFGNIQEGNALLLNCKDSFVVARGNRLTAALGLNNILVVDTDDALLVADLAHSQEVKDVINRLMERGLTRLL